MFMWFYETNPAVYMYTRTFIVMTIKSEKNSSYVKKKAAYLHKCMTALIILAFFVLMWIITIPIILSWKRMYFV